MMNETKLLCFAVISILFQLAIGASTPDFSWFKNTKYHQDNIDLIGNGGWTRCENWQYELYEEGAEEFDVEIKLGLFNPVNPSFKIPRPRNDRFNFTAKCLTIQVPLFWDGSYYVNDSSLKVITYHMARVYSVDNEDNTANNGAYWLLSGGPGGDGVGMYNTAIPWLNFINSTYDAYIPDHRGTGSSGDIKCPWTLGTAKCAQFLYDKFGNDTYQYTTKNAAIDLGYTINLFNENMDAYNDKNTIIYGISYGTYYLNKYLQIFPDQVNAVILDGICPPDKCRIITYDEKVNAVGLDFLEKCDSDSFCREQFKEYNYSSKNALKKIYKQAADNNDTMPCWSNCYVDTTTFKRMLFGMLADEYERARIPPLIKRLARCNNNDQNVVNYMFEDRGDVYSYHYCPSPSISTTTPTPNTSLSSPSTTSTNSTMQPLFTTNDPNYTSTAFSTTPEYDNNTFRFSYLGPNILNSEMYYGLDPTDPGPSIERLNNLSSTYYFAAGINGEEREVWDVWNKYIPDDSYYLNYADPSIPMLILNGDLDPQTPVEWGIGSAIQYKANINNDTMNEKNRYYYTIPYAPHFVWYRSAITNYSDYQLDVEKETETCGFYLISSFIDPNRNWVPDSKCFNWLLGIDWMGTNNITKQISILAFGTVNMWEGDINGTSSPTNQPTKIPSNEPSKSPTKIPIFSPTEYPRATETQIAEESTNVYVATNKSTLDANSLIVIIVIILILCYY